MAKLYNMDLENPQKPFKFVEGRKYAEEFWGIDEDDLNPYKTKKNVKSSINNQTLAAVPYKDDMELDIKEFEKHCNRTEKNEEKVKFQKKGANREKHKSKGEEIANGVGSVLGAVAGAALGAVASAATAAGHAVAGAGADAAVGHEVVELAHDWKDGADIILHKIHIK